MIKMILCTDDKNGIGLDNSIPWFSSDDFKHFKSETINSVILMGYNTWKSLPNNSKPLSDRVNVIMYSKNIDNNIMDEYYKNHPTSNAIFIHQSSLQQFIDNNRNVIIIGGAKLYSLCIDKADIIVKSTIQGDYNCDTFFDIHAYNAFTVFDMKTLDDGTIVEYLRK